MSSYTIETILNAMVEHNASDVYLTVGCPPSLRMPGQVSTYGTEPMTDDNIRELLRGMIGDEHLAEFDRELEYNTAIHTFPKARFRLNAFRQMGKTGMVLRKITNEIPTVESLQLPDIYNQLIMEKYGLILLVGPTGSGKSTSLAAMIGHRNRNGSGHIITIEDPIEFLHEHDRCIITQRDIGTDTHSLNVALRNAYRQRPDVVLIGEIRDRETMENAIIFSETGHLCLATLHAHNTNQAIDRIVSLFPQEAHRQILLSLSMNLRAVLSQRLVNSRNGERCVAVEVMLNRGLIRNHIEMGKIKEIREMIEKGSSEGMQTFDQALLNLYLNGTITEETAISESDNPAGLRLQMRKGVAFAEKPVAAVAQGSVNPGQHFKI